MIDPGTRCLEPVEYYELSGRPRTDIFPVCWRRKGHSGGHLSRFAYENELELHRRQRQARRAARMTDPGDRTRS
jgi:hypothetical protein